MFSGFPSGCSASNCSEWIVLMDKKLYSVRTGLRAQSTGGLQVITVVSQGAKKMLTWEAKKRKRQCLNLWGQSVFFRRIKSLSSINTPFAPLTFLYMRLKRAMRICMPRWCRPKMAGCSRRKRAVNSRQRPRARKYPWLRSGAWNGSKEAMMRPRSWGCTVLEASYNKWWENNKISDELICSTF